MKVQHLPLYAIALAILIAGLAVAGAPIQTILLALLVLACPLMMLSMHVGHGGHGESDQNTGQPGERRPGSTAGLR